MGFINIFYLSIALQVTEHWLGECGITFSPYRTINEIETVRPACSFISLSIMMAQYCVVLNMIVLKC